MSSLKKAPKRQVLHEIEPINRCQYHNQRNQYHRLDKARSHLLHKEEGHHHGYQHEDVITYISHHLNIFLNAIGIGVSNSIGSPVMG